MHIVADLIAMVIDASLIVTSNACLLEACELHRPTDGIGAMALRAIEDAVGHARFVRGVVEDDASSFAWHCFEFWMAVGEALEL
jgi:hypothetical protein